MAYRFLKGSTALTVMLSLAVPPLPLLAQATDGGDAGAAPEVAPDEEALRRAAEAAAEAAQAAAAAEAAAEEAARAASEEMRPAAEEEADRAAAAAEDAARAAAAAEAAANAADVESQAVMPPPEEQVEPQPEPDPVPAPTEDPAPEAAPEPEVTQTPEPETEAAQTPAPEADTPAPEADTPALESDTPAPEADTPAPESEEAETPLPDAPPETAETPVPETEPSADAAPDTETDAAEAPEPADPAPASDPAPADADIAEPAPAEPAPAETERDNELRPEDEEAAEPAPAAPAPGETETAAPPQDPASADLLPESAIIGLIEPDADTPPPAAADEAPDPDAPPVVTTTVLTDEDVRSSDEEFEVIPNAAVGEGLPISRSGLSRTETAVLAGLAGLAVGAVLAGGSRVASNTGDRVVIERPDGSYRVLKDDDVLLRRPGNTLRTETFSDGSTRTFVLRDDGSEVVTVRDASGRVLRRSVIDPFGNETQLFDDTRTYAPVDVTTLPRRESRMDLVGSGDRESLRLALALAEQQDLGRSFSLQQVRDIVDVRELAPEITLDAITFETASSVVRPEMAARLREVGLLMREMVAENPREVFLVEGHTDAVGGWAYNLALSDRRAESVALALTEYFEVPPENMVVQGYGKAHLKIDTQAAQEANRRVAVRRVTPLLNWAVASAQ